MEVRYGENFGADNTRKEVPILGIMTKLSLSGRSSMIWVKKDRREQVFVD